MTLEKIILDNFKNHDLLEVPIGKGVVVSGKNGEGKTSVLESVIAGLYNRDLFGSSGTHRFIQEGKRVATVTLEFGEVNIARHIKVSSCPVLVNGEEATNASLEEYIPPVDVGLAMLNPMYLFYADDNTKRKLFMGLLPKADRKRVFIQMFGEKNVSKFMATGKTKVRDDIKTMTNEVKHSEVKIQEYKFKLTDSRNQLGALKKEFDSTEWNNGDVSELLEVSDRLAKMEKAKAVYESVEEKLNAFKSQASKLVVNSGREVENIKELIIEDEEEFAKIDSLMTEVIYQKENANIRLVSIREMKETGVCPICGREVESIPNADTFKEKISQFTDLHKELSERKDELVARLEKARGFQVGIRSALEEIEGIDFNLEEYNKLLKDKEVLKVKYKEELEGESTQSRVKIETEMGILSENVASYEEEIESLERKIKRLNSELEDLEQLRQAYSSKGVDAKIIEQQTKEVTKAFAKYVDNIEVVSTRPNKSNAGFKQVFDVFVDGVEFHNLSYGERLKVSVAMSLVVRDLSEKKFGFILLDETAILSKSSLKEVEKWIEDGGIILIRTQLTEDKFSIDSNG